jgi:aminoglycoside phosphotransferase
MMVADFPVSGDDARLPEDLRPLVRDAEWRPDSVGMSALKVFALERGGQPTQFLKIAHRNVLDDLAGERDRLRWLQHKLPVPEVLWFGEQDELTYLLMSAIPGTMTHLVPRDAIPSAVRCLGLSLRQIHALPVRDCPFDARLDVRIAQAFSRVEKSEVDLDDLDPERQGRTAAELFAELLARRPATEDLVFTHGDYCLPNVLLRQQGGEWQLSGFIDWARAGVADRSVDLGIAARSITHNFGGEWVAPFFEAYGTAPDQNKVAYYQLLDEFF